MSADFRDELAEIDRVRLEDIRKRCKDLQLELHPYQATNISGYALHDYTGEKVFIGSLSDIESFLRGADWWESKVLQQLSSIANS